MTTGSIIFTLIHVLIFTYTRRKYVRKYKLANKEKVHFEAENIQLRSKLETYEKYFSEDED